MREKKTFSIPSPIVDALAKNVEVNKTITVTRAINNASKNKRQFLKFVEDNLNTPLVRSRITLLTVYLDEQILSRLENLRILLSKRIGIDFSLSRTLSFVLMHYLIELQSTK